MRDFSIPRGRAIAFLPVLCLLCFLAFVLVPVSRTRLFGGDSLVLFSEEGGLLHADREPAGGSYREWVAFSSLPPHVPRTFQLAEDRRFQWHPGFDPFALLRALVQNARAGRVVSGGSTITQQLARLIFRDRMPAAALLRKVAETASAVRLEAHLNKTEILELYLNRIPFPRNRTGIAAAARELLGKDARLLSPEEAIALAVLARGAPGSQDRFLSRFGALCERALPGGSCRARAPAARELYARMFPAGAARHAANEGTPGPRRGVQAGHFADWFRASFPNVSGPVRTTLQKELNERVVRILDQELASLSERRAHDGAVIILERPVDSPRELVLRSMVGSRNFAAAGTGQVNGTIAIRSAGSTMKPLLYAFAMDQRGLRPWHKLQDRGLSLPTFQPGESYSPTNYDGKNWGELTVREALGSSRNVPTVALARLVGLGALLAFFREAGFRHLRGAPDTYGPALALGSGGASLFQLARAYGVFLSGGELLAVRAGTQRSAPLVFGQTRRILSQAAALRITGILSDPQARRRAFGRRSNLEFPFEVAAKTGSSTGYTDSWTIGYTTRHIVGVWVGNFDGRPTLALSGAAGAGRIFQSVLRLATEGARPRFAVPEGWRRFSVCQKSGQRAGLHCPGHEEIFAPGEKAPEQTCAQEHDGTRASAPAAQPSIRRPAPGQIFVLDPRLPVRSQQVPLSLFLPRQSAAASRNEYSYTVDGGSPVLFAGSVETALLLGPGRHTVRIHRNREAIDEVSFFVR